MLGAESTVIRMIFYWYIVNGNRLPVSIGGY